MTDYRPTFDMRITFGNIITLVAMGAGFIWGYADFKAQFGEARGAIQRAEAALATKANQADVGRIDTRVVSLELARDDLRERMIRVELQLQHQNELLQGIAEAVGVPRPGRTAR
ncbi:hypothetical protein D5400_11785 [Georhizobium profundi]|uniref:Uncharacterized protein n=1 Tax=Georhizobium profundi TaxID=2341112 RepID=A0A3Q8XR29_9HYPH|nr:hypothetical protein [Georhizobium profundi]AZN71869.1 hypothetical protein D5400_11785 [Georhizobium profundi]